jgi:hypothetical protein
LNHFSRSQKTPCRSHLAAERVHVLATDGRCEPAHDLVE